MLLPGQPVPDPTLESLDARLSNMEAVSIARHDRSDVFRERTVKDLTELNGKVDAVDRKVDSVDHKVDVIGQKVDGLVTQSNMAKGRESAYAHILVPVASIITGLIGAWLLITLGLK